MPVGVDTARRTDDGRGWRWLLVGVSWLSLGRPERIVLSLVDLTIGCIAEVTTGIVVVVVRTSV